MNQGNSTTTIDSSLKIRSFTQLNAWKEGHKLVLSIYRLTRAFPAEEAFGLVSQMRRSAVAITSNIAEGFSRQSYKEKVQFYAIAHGSVTELQNQLLISRDTQLISKADFEKVAEQAIGVHKLLSGLLRASRGKTRNS